jgi:hypothetical protein
MECEYGYANTRIFGVLVFACPKLLAMNSRHSRSPGNEDGSWDARKLIT